MKRFAKKIAAGVALAGVVATNAMAALPPEVETAATAAKTDIAEAGGIIIGVVIAIAAVGWVRRVIR